MPKATVLIADDSMFMRNLIKDLLSRHGYQVIAEAPDGYDAVALYEEKRPDIAILDLIMPKMNGLHALKQILLIDPNAKVIMCSSMGQKYLTIEALQIGAKDFIVKPYINELVLSLNKLCS
ncbi:two-component system response regulator [Geobacillus thermodenitrificans]|uniref:Response regulator n=1 Tax=Geobacillus thermodenitrificans TaxID=33940 RepID=A0ABY9Q985_GEOTD|nr:response regulator [Geobacillus thermodenitrificans]ATO38742.1 two-component system response regulator [Geobacillus thermodenitrificans]WMV75000.1 response regulator [Geobacillus thermodenitrificans]